MTCCFRLGLGQAAPAPSAFKPVPVLPGYHNDGELVDPQPSAYRELEGTE